MATWKKIINDGHNLSELADVNANGSAAGQLLIYNNSTSKYVPAVLQTGTYLTVTNTDGSVSIDQTSANLNDRLGSITQTDVTIGAVGGGTAAADRDIKLEGAVYIGESAGLYTSPDAVGTNQTSTHGKIYTPRPTGNAEGARFSIEIPNTAGSSGSSLNTTSRAAFLIDPNGASGAIINIGETGDTTNITGVASLTKPTIAGDVTSTGVNVDWDLKDNTADAISFDSAGKAGILAIDTTDAGEKVKMSGNCEITGSLTVTGDVTTVSSSQLVVADKLITLADGAANAASAHQAGITVDIGSEAQANRPTIRWNANAVGGGVDGTAAGSGLTGWELRNNMTSSHAAGHPIAIMDFNTGAPSGNSAGKGAMYFDTTNAQLYVRTA
tara:strand:+ start:654 stop:1805 length:1152 start_codon:yes stop_codon:yes gene_type:complete